MLFGKFPSKNLIDDEAKKALVYSEESIEPESMKGNTLPLEKAIIATSKNRKGQHEEYHNSNIAKYFESLSF